MQADSIELTSLTIRTGSEPDLPALEWDGEYRHFRRVYRRAMEEARRGARVLLLAEVEDMVVGQLFVQFRGTDLSGEQRGRFGYLHAFRVRPPYRNRGIGTRLVSEAEAVLQQRGYWRALIAVAIGNKPALALYQRLGYAITGRDRGEWSYSDHLGKVCHVHEPSYVLEKPLPAAASVQ
ncbi:MAG: GNAT family N-acetyltransferase [Anaerolineales bacterium]|nr:GNAT family N-acetyltransferase [Anaerolineales bacterium]